jgi:hypothetical protein
MSTFVLQHPAWFGGWCWKKVVPLLRVRGHAVFTPTLTASGPARAARRTCEGQTWIGWSRPKSTSDHRLWLIGRPIWLPSSATMCRRRSEGYQPSQVEKRRRRALKQPAAS